jgi:alpha-amylase/alpha-mannosidase (GH57 family)
VRASSNTGSKATDSSSRSTGSNAKAKGLPRSRGPGAIEQHICIHGHFYQPFRENPWFGEIEEEDSAHPFHDWNDRVTRECYSPNGAARLLDEKGRITGIVSNYERISADFGPTLLGWLERNRPEAYHAILDGDRASRTRFSGHGSAIAQMYNHTIAPLDSLRDRRTQAIWGLADFEHRFGRKSEGMWLPETAVDIPTLDILAELGVKFTILAPHQARAFRPISEEAWQDAAGRLDPKTAYLCRLPSGRSIAVFFYDGPVARDVAFGPLLTDGRTMAARLRSALDSKSDRPQLENVAVDGETFGHHHQFGDMALASCLREVETSPVRLTVYGEYLERFPPSHEVTIKENTAWSCSHGIARWRADCGDNTGSHPGWNQAWRTPLRAAMDWLRDRLAPIYEQETARLVRDAWQTRDDYITVVMDRSPGNVERFVADHAARTLEKDETVRLLKLLELQRFAMLQYSSDGWFFDDISELTTVQVLRCAARTIQLCRETVGQDLEAEFSSRLKAARSNLPEYGDGAKVYASLVLPAVIDLPRAGAHFAMSSIFSPSRSEFRLGCFAAKVEERRPTEVGSQKLTLGRVHVTSEVTREEELFTFAVLNFGGHRLSAWMNNRIDDAERADVDEKAAAAFLWGDVAEVIRVVERSFGTHGYTFGDILRDGQRRILTRIIDETVEWLEPLLEEGLERCYPSALAMREVGMKPPNSLAIPLSAMLNTSFRLRLERDSIDLDRLRALSLEFRPGVVEPDRDAVAPAASLSIEKLIQALATADWLSANAKGQGKTDELLDRAVGLFDILAPLKLPLDLWQSQNLFFPLVAAAHLELLRRAESGDKEAATRAARFKRLAEYLNIRVA